MFATATLALLLAAQNDTYTLQWKFKEGETFYSKTTAASDFTVEVMGQKIEQTVTMKMVQRFKVKSAKEGATVVELTNLDFGLDAPGLPGANVGDKFKNVTFTATLDKDLEVTKLEGYDKFLDAVADGDADQKKLAKALMPEAVVKQFFTQTFVVAPNKPLAVGDTWERKEKAAFGQLGNVEAKSVFKLTGVKAGVATVAVKGDLAFKAADIDTGLPFKITKLDLKADKYTGTHQFDIKAGRVTETKVEMEMAGTMSISAAGMDIDAKVRQKMTTTGVITDKNPIVD
jgi:hypothetical protein